MNTDINFIIEVEKLKQIKRRSRHLFDMDRENDAEHSFHIALMAYVLRDYLDFSVNLERVVELLLFHDLVEIYAGDTYAYDVEGNKSKKDREMKAAEKLYGILDPMKEEYYKNIWFEFENCISPEAIYANGLDRLQPILLNFYNNGGTWVEYGTTREMVDKRAEKIRQVSPKFKELITNILDEAEKRKYFK